LIHRKELETHDFLNYRTLKPGGEFDEVKRSNMSVLIENQSQSKPRLCGNQTIVRVQRIALPWFGQERQPGIYDLDASEQLSACWQIKGTGMATAGSK
jgi:hypothetical protein